MATRAKPGVPKRVRVEAQTALRDLESPRASTATPKAPAGTTRPQVKTRVIRALKKLHPMD